MTRYKYRCWSTSGFVHTGIGITELPLNSDELAHKILNLVSKNIHELHIPWNPFNVSLVVEAQPVLKQKDPYQCPVCGSTKQAHLCL